MVELRISGSESPTWGTLANLSMGGCFVETTASQTWGANAEVSLWIASCHVWLKGLTLNGAIAPTNSGFGMRIKFGTMNLAEEEALRRLLILLEGSAKNDLSTRDLLQD
jgi:hypothetical protein